MAGPYTDWPTSLPTRFEPGRFRDLWPEITARNPNEKGRMRMRRQLTAGIRRVVGALDMTAAQVATLRIFHRDTLRMGELPFQGFADPRSDLEAIWRFAAPPIVSAVGPIDLVAILELVQVNEVVI